MPTAVPELIALEIVGRLQLITIDNGYSFDVSEVIRPTRNGENWLMKNLGVGVMQGNSERVPDLDCPGNPPAIAYSLEMNLHCIVKDSETSTAAHATNENEMAAAVVTAITSDGGQWFTMNGVAVNTEIGTHEPFISPEGESNGVTVPMTITYRVSETNPYEVRS